MNWMFWQKGNPQNWSLHKGVLQSYGNSFAIIQKGTYLGDRGYYSPIKYLTISFGKNSHAKYLFAHTKWYVCIFQLIIPNKRFSIHDWFNTDWLINSWGFIYAWLVRFDSDKAWIGWSYVIRFTFVQNLMIFDKYDKINHSENILIVSWTDWSWLLFWGLYSFDCL